METYVVVCAFGGKVEETFVYTQQASAMKKAQEMATDDPFNDPDKADVQVFHVVKGKQAEKLVYDGMLDEWRGVFDTMSDVPVGEKQDA